MNRDTARPKLSTVNKALNELQDLSIEYFKHYFMETSCITATNLEEDFKKKWNVILDKYDLNYNDLTRWNTTP